MTELEYYTIFHKKLEINRDVSLLRKNVSSYLSERTALINAIMYNFEIIEETNPFYDPEDEIGNNYFFKDTPQSRLSEFNLKWETPQELISFNRLYELSVNELNKILEIQKEIIIPNVPFEERKSWLYSHEYMSIKKYKARSLV